MISLLSNIISKVTRNQKLPNPASNHHHHHRSFHTNVMPHTQGNMEQWFNEIVKLPSPPPDRINGFIDRISSSSRGEMIVSEFQIRSNRETQSWKVKGLRTNTTTNNKEEPKKRRVIIASGFQAHERGTICVGLYIAYRLAAFPLKGVDLSVFPLIHPRDYLTNQWKTKEMLLKEKNPFPGPALNTYGSSVLQSLISKTHGKNYLPLQFFLTPEYSSVRPSKLQQQQQQLLQHHLQQQQVLQQLQQPQQIYQQMKVGEFFGVEPAILVEIRDQQGVCDERNIVSRGEEVIRGVQEALEETKRKGLRGW